jgi:ankyrin repeat protein
MYLNVYDPEFEQTYIHTFADSIDKLNISNIDFEIKTSTKLDAGQGLFTKQDIPKGTIFVSTQDVLRKCNDLSFDLNTYTHIPHNFSHDSNTNTNNPYNGNINPINIRAILIHGDNYDDVNTPIHIEVIKDMCQDEEFSRFYGMSYWNKFYADYIVEKEKSEHKDIIDDLCMIQKYYEYHSKHTDNEFIYYGACKYGDLVKIKEMEKILSEKIINDGLMIACLNKQKEIVKYFIDTNFKLNVFKITCCEKTPFIFACSGGDINIVKMLLDDNKNIIYSGEIYDALTYTCKNNHIELMKYLINLCEAHKMITKEDIEGKKCICHFMCADNIYDTCYIGATYGKNKEMKDYLMNMYNIDKNKDIIKYVEDKVSNAS